MYPEMIGIECKQLFALIPGINKLKDLPANQIIIAIDNGHNLPTPAEIPRGIINIGQCLFILLILNKLHPLIRNLILLDILLNLLSSAILRGIININDMIVLIILPQNRIEIPEIFILIFIAGDYDAERNLLVLADLILLLVLKLLLEHELLHPLD